MSKQQTWGGRFTESPAELVQEYTESVSYDRALYAQDIAGSQAHVTMLASRGVIARDEAQTLIEGLDVVRAEIESGRFEWKRELEDVHMNIEQRLTELVGDVGKKLHTGRSRNDQVALDFRLFVSGSLGEWSGLLERLIAVLANRAGEHAETLLPGYTHLQPAQPVSLGQHLLAYAWMFKRDAGRLADCDTRARVSPLGAAALAGTTYPLDPIQVAESLGMPAAFDNSMDAVSDRDFAVEATFCASMIMMHLSRLCEEIILWANPAFGFVRLPDAYATGSSIMPQKKNPDVAELMRGKTGRVYGSLTALLTLMKSLPLAYNRDMQEDKEPFLDAHATVRRSLALMAGMLEKLEFVPGRMAEALRRGYLNATELADYLVGKGLPFREAHHVTGRAVALAERQGVGLEDLPLDALQELTPLIEADLYPLLDPVNATARRKLPGGAAPDQVRRQISRLRDWLGRG